MLAAAIVPPLPSISTAPSTTVKIAHSGVRRRGCSLRLVAPLVARSRAVPERDDRVVAGRLLLPGVAGRSRPAAGSCRPRGRADALAVARALALTLRELP